MFFMRYDKAETDLSYLAKIVLSVVVVTQQTALTGPV